MSDWDFLPPDLRNDFEAEFAGLMTRPPIAVELSMPEVWALIAAVQTAGLFPDFLAPSRTLARNVAEGLIAYLAPHGTAMRIILEKGWELDDRSEAAGPEAAPMASGR